MKLTTVASRESNALAPTTTIREMPTKDRDYHRGTVTLDKEAMHALCIEGYPTVPHGGTHAKTRKIGTLDSVTIKNKSGTLRVSYEVI